MYLTHKDYSEPEKIGRAIPDVKGEIRTFVGTGRKSYEEIVKEIQKTHNMTNDEIIEQIEEVAQESDYSPRGGLELIE